MGIMGHHHQVGSSWRRAEHHQGDPVPFQIGRVVTTGSLEETHGEGKGLFSPYGTRGPNFGVHRGRVEVTEELAATSKKWSLRTLCFQLEPHGM